VLEKSKGVQEVKKKGGGRGKENKTEQNTRQCRWFWKDLGGKNTNKILGKNRQKNKKVGAQGTKKKAEIY